MSLVADVRLGLGALQLQVELTAERGETLALLGPNGAGKTTLLRALSGLTPIDAGRIELDGTVLDDGRRTFVPPERRPVAVTFQDYLLFPHLSALDNVAFGLRTRGLRRTAARSRARVALEQVDLADRAAAKPKALSGGQAQRVALARALATEPLLLLLDEPLAALDQGARGAVRRELRARLATFPGVRLLVTHDPLDAAVLADRLVIIEEGNVVQRGSFAEVAARPRSRYVAELVGVNLLSGTARRGVLDLSGGATLAASDAATGSALAVVHPRSVALHRERPEGSPRNVNEGRVESIELFGDRVRVRVGGSVPLVSEITPAALRELELVEGTMVWTSVKATDIDVYAA